MSLTIGSAPFGNAPGGIFNFKREGSQHILYFEDVPRTVRGVFAGQTIISSRRVKMLHETERLPVWYFPIDEVRMDLLEPSNHSSHSLLKGKASYWSIRVGDRFARNAAWSYAERRTEAPALAGYVAFEWQAMDAWYEEDEEVFVHPRDPYHRVDVLRSSRRVRVRLGDVVLADCDRPRILFETGLPPRYYLPSTDVHMDLLVASETVTRCPYKGAASYFSTRSPMPAGRDVVWTYLDPLPEVGPIKGLLCFYNERVDLEVDGELEKRPTTRFSPRVDEA
jgi:uncharacterized protein (DUF427 family)